MALNLIYEETSIHSKERGERERETQCQHTPSKESTQACLHVSWMS